MNLTEYAEWVWQRHEPDPVYVGFYWDNLREACEGLASESGELLQCQRKMTYERTMIPPGEFLIEAADVLHYLALFCRQAGVGVDDLANINMSKLKARDLGRQADFEMMFRAWKPEVELLREYLDRVNRMTVLMCTEGDADEPMQ